MEPNQYVRVRRIIAHFAKKSTKKYKKGRQVSEVYAKKYPKRVEKRQFLIIEQRELKYDKKLKHQVFGRWRLIAKERLTHYEFILKLQKMTSTLVAETLARHRVYSNIWMNDRGIVRVTINGHVGRRRIKVMQYIPYMKRLWEQKHKGYEKFKRYILHKILSMLSARKLRMSNDQQARLSLVNLRKSLEQEREALDSCSYVGEKKHQENKIRTILSMIRRQKTSKQVQGGTIRIEKLIHM